MNDPEKKIPAADAEPETEKTDGSAEKESEAGGDSGEGRTGTKLGSTDS